MPRFLTAWCSGLLLVQVFPALPDEEWRWLLLLLAGALGRFPGLRPLACAIAGCCWALWHADAALSERLPLSREGATLVVQGRIDDLPERTAVGMRFMLAGVTSTRRASWPDGRQKIRLTAFAPRFALEAGADCTLYVRLRQPRGIRSPGAFDAERWYFGNGIDALGYVVTHPGNTCTPHALSLGRLRQSIAASITARISAPDTASILAALAVGARADITPLQWEVLRATGVVHLVSVSGLHVAMVAIGAFVIARTGNAACALVLRRDPRPWVPAVCAFLAAFAYAFLAGFSVPTQRSLVMIALALRNRLLAQPLLSWESLLLAAALLLTVAPETSLTLSFWLSFGTLALLLMLDGLRPRSGWRYRWIEVHFLLALLLAPLLAFAFQAVPLASPMANIVAIPAVTFLIVPLMLIGSLLLPISDAGASLCFTLASALWQGTWQVLQTLAALFPVVVLPFQPPLALFGLSLLAALLMLSPLRTPRWLWPPVLGALYLLTPQRALREGEFELAMLDVGQGLSVVVTTARHVLVYDTGARFPGGGDLGTSVVVPYLRQRGVRHVDRLIVSHGDIDHAGGAPAVARAMPVAEVMSSDMSILADVPASSRVRCREGQRWTWDGVHFEVLHPGEPPPAQDNDRSCVLRIRGGATADPRGARAALLTGDISVHAEQILRRHQPLAAMLLVVPHHGSHTSSSPAFVAAVASRLALFSAGHRNRFNHPAPSVRDRYLRRGSVALETAMAGTTRVRFTATRVHVHTERQAHRRYWDPG